MRRRGQGRTGVERHFHGLPPLTCVCRRRREPARGLRARTDCTDTGVTPGATENTCVWSKCVWRTQA